MRSCRGGLVRARPSRLPEHRCARVLVRSPPPICYLLACTLHRIAARGPSEPSALPHDFRGAGPPSSYVTYRSIGLGMGSFSLLGRVFASLFSPDSSG
jgi:hypothetical protein